MRTHHIFAAVAAVAALTVAACSPSGAPKGAATGTGAQAAAPGECAGGAAKLPTTKLCPADAAALIPDSQRILASGFQLNDDCAWEVLDAPGLTPTEALVYIGVRCGTKVTQLELRGGARSGALGYVSSGLYDNIGPEVEHVRLFPLTGASDPEAYILSLTRQTAPNRRHAAACIVRAGGEGYPEGAIVVDLPDAYRAANRIPADQYGLCGDYGITDASGTYWLAQGAYAWWVDFGQDTPDFLPNSVTFVTIGPNGVTRATP